MTYNIMNLMTGCIYLNDIKKSESISDYCKTRLSPKSCKAAKATACSLFHSRSFLYSILPLNIYWHTMN